MTFIQKILVPVDFSAHGAIAIHTAQTFAKALGAELVLLHVTSEPSFVLAGQERSPRIVEEYERAMNRKLEEVARSIEPCISVSTRLVCGVPYQAIVDIADKEPFDMIVMGTHGHSGLQRWLLGSVAERVVRTARTPVMTVPNGEPFASAEGVRSVV